MKTLYSFTIALLLLSCSNNDQPTRYENEQLTRIDSLRTLEQYAQETTIQVLDTDFSKGRLLHQQEISLWDIQKMHGHLCDGLVVGFIGLREALYELYPDSIIDRTNTRIISKSSPCIGDVGLFISGGRYQFNSFYVDNSISGIYQVERIDNKKAVMVNLKDGVKPTEIDELGSLAVKNELSSCGLDSLQKMEEDFSYYLFENAPSNLFKVEKLTNFEWNPILKNDFTKTDILNKTADNCEIK
jgi:acetolactate decarboxylase